MVSQPGSKTLPGYPHNLLAGLQNDKVNQPEAPKDNFDSEKERSERLQLRSMYAWPSGNQDEPPVTTDRTSDNRGGLALENPVGSPQPQQDDQHKSNTEEDNSERQDFLKDIILLFF